MMTNPETQWQVPSSSERPKSTSHIVDAAIASIWEGYLALLQQGKTTISFEEFKILLELGVTAAAKKQKKLQDEEINRKVKSEQIAKWVDDKYGSYYD